MFQMFLKRNAMDELPGLKYGRGYNFELWRTELSKYAGVNSEKFPPFLKPFSTLAPVNEKTL